MAAAPTPAGDETPGAEDMAPVHASCVALDGAGLLILGPSGSGKSGLALDLMARGAALVADDRVRLRREGDSVMADVPETIRGRIEARGVGILNAQAAGPVPLTLVVDLGASETARLPERRVWTCLGCDIPLLHNPGMSHFTAALVQYMKAGRHE